MSALRRARLCLATALALSAHAASAQVGGLPQEAAGRAAADVQLQTNINAEAAARTAGDARLQTNINNEAAARQAADTQLQSNINAEATARSGMDAVLLDQIGQERVARLAAEADLAARIGAGGGQTSIEGRYATVGSGTCLSSSTGFAANLSPIIVVPPPPPPFPIPGQTDVPPPPPPPVAATVLQVGTSSVNGVRTFGANNRGTFVATVTTVNHPSFTPWGVNRIGGGSASTLEGAFSYLVDGDNLIIDDDDDAVGMITQGGGAGAATSSRGQPRFVGKISKDRKTILIAHERVAVEQGVFTPAGQMPQITDRVCERQRILSRID
jgi:hypothetical protein